jgi:hypothetical protein
VAARRSGQVAAFQRPSYNLNVGRFKVHNLDVGRFKEEDLRKVAV